MSEEPIFHSTPCNLSQEIWMNLYLTEEQGYDKPCAQILTLADLHNLILCCMTGVQNASKANHPGAQHLLLDLAERLDRTFQQGLSEITEV